MAETLCGAVEKVKAENLGAHCCECRNRKVLCGHHIANALLDQGISGFDDELLQS